VAGPASPRVVAAGFTLLELLVVMALIGLMAGLAMPRMYALYNSASMAYDKDQILLQLSRLGYQARSARTGLVLDRLVWSDPVALMPVLPEGWTVVADAPVNYYANGVCGGGAVTLIYGDRRQRWGLAPPLCRPTPL